MIDTRRLAAAMGLAILMTVGAFPAAATACSCIAAPLCESLWQPERGAPAYFEATVAAMAPAPGGALRVQLRDVRPVHGASATSVVTSASGDSCGFPFVVGERYLIDASVQDDGTASVSRCSKTSLLEDARESLDYLASLAGPPAGGRIFGRAALVVAGLRLFDDDERRPLAGLRIRLAGPVSRVTRADRNGGFSFSGLPPGRYRLEAVAPPGARLPDGARDDIALPNGYACRETGLFFERPRR